MRIAGPIRCIEHPQDLEMVLERSYIEPVLIFKHSSTCSLSLYASEQIERLREDTDPPVYQVTVQASRALSNAIADRLRVHHASPQAILIYRNKAVYNASHMRINAANIRQASQHARNHRL